VFFRIYLKPGFRYKSIEEFWTIFGDELRSQNMHIEVPPIKSSTDFAMFMWHQNRNRFFDGKRVVIFADEFDTLYYASDQVIEGVLADLRAIKHNPNVCLQVSFLLKFEFIAPSLIMLFLLLLLFCYTNFFDLL
jgi:hypothetical protein